MPRKAILALTLLALGTITALAQTDDTAYGTDALEHNTGNYNSAFGAYALLDNTTGPWNTGFGALALYSNTTGQSNSAFGESALYSNTGSNNTAVGDVALYTNTSGGENTAVGEAALEANTSGSDNTAVGQLALWPNATGVGNIGIGREAGYDNPADGSYNIDIGSVGSSSDSDAIRIGTPGTQTSFYAAGVDGVTVSGGVAVYINSSGQLGTVSSSIRFKEDVRDMGDASNAIFRLRPVTYRYKQPFADGSKPIDYGLIAEEVADVYPDMVVKGADGQIQTVQYQKLTPMLLNELQKQHRLVEQMAKALEEQRQTVARQQETIELLKAQQTGTVQSLEKRLGALESAQRSGSLEARAAAQ
jgi:hypothetical protein